jgi:hypothetical protein
MAEPRAFYMLARIKARLPCLYARDARLCPVPRVGSMGASEKTYRMYGCGRCAEQVRICSDCDHGNVYCAGECAQIRRRESLCRAGERYQLSYRGACLHAARQSAWRSRQAQIVTHQGSLPSADTLIVAAISTQTTTEGTHVDIASIQPPPQPHSMPRVALSAAHTRAHIRWHAHRMAPSAQSCSFCWRALPAFARLGPLRGGP